MRLGDLIQWMLLTIVLAAMWYWGFLAGQSNERAKVRILERQAIEQHHAVEVIP